VYHLVVYPDREQWFYFVRGTYLPRVAAMGVTAGLTTIYLRMCNLPQGESRRPLDIIVAFVGGYGRAKRLQRDIHEWEGRYRVVVENSNDLIFILNRNGQVLNANEAALRKLGFDAGRMTGFFLPGILESGGKLRCNWSALWQELEEAATDESDIHVVRREWELRSVTGGRIFLDASVSRAELHEQPVAVVIGRDMTERHRLDRRERHLQQRMSQIQRLEAVGSLAGGVAHDFNNILHTIQANLDRVGGNQSGLSETQQEVIENIRTATTRASSLTNQLLGYARQGRYELALLDVSDVVERVRIMFDPVARGRLDFRVLVAPDAMIVNADSTQLEQVFLNMLLNARDAVAKKREPRIVFRAEPVAEHTPGWAVRPDPQLLPEQYVCLRVKDNGSGISERIRTRIFEPFFTTKEMGKGTGMGLAMAYGCILNHQGWIHVESQVGRGTEFIVFLPRA
jgi:PAS domain S-box-containing protein